MTLRIVSLSLTVAALLVACSSGDSSTSSSSGGSSSGGSSSSSGGASSSSGSSGSCEEAKCAELTCTCGGFAGAKVRKCTNGVCAKTCSEAGCS